MKTLKQYINEGIFGALDLTDDDYDDMMHDSIEEFIKSHYVIGDGRNVSVADRYTTMDLEVVGRNVTIGSTSLGRKNDKTEIAFTGGESLDNKGAAIISGNFLTVFITDSKDTTPLKNLTGCPGVTKYLYLDSDSLLSLKGCPTEITLLKITGCKQLKNLSGLPTSFNLKDFVLYLKRAEIKSFKGMESSHIASVSIEECNNIKDLKNFAKSTDSVKIFKCDNLKSLEGLGLVSNYLNISGVPIKNLKGCENAQHDITISYCDYLESLEGLPETVNGTLRVHKCKNISDFTHLPKLITKSLYISKEDNWPSDAEIRKICKIRGKIYREV